MINKNIIFGLFILGFLGGCTSPTAMLGPAYSLSSSGSTFQAGLSYGSTELITSYTGKTPLENFQEIGSSKKNIKKKTLESEEFFNLINKKIKKTNKILKLSSQ